jgi:hypothetical protein
MIFFFGPFFSFLFQVWCYGKSGSIFFLNSKISYIFTIKKNTIQKEFLVNINEIYPWKGNPFIHPPIT